MPKGKSLKIERGVWSATPTPFTDSMRIDKVAVRRMVAHHLRLGVKGLFLAGTCGGGPWMPDRERRELVQAAAKHAKGKLLLAVQVTDNSAARILDNMRRAKDDGADIAVIAPPYFVVHPTADKIRDLYLEAIRNSPLPVGIYDRGAHSSVAVPSPALKAIYAEENVILIKDSSTDPERRAIVLAAKRKRPGLRALNGDEFDCVTYLKAGYDGLLLGGGIFIGYVAGQIMQAVDDGDLERAEKLQARMARIMFAVYGGKKITCWLKGLKTLLVRMGVFRTTKGFLPYPLTKSCSRAIDRALQRDADVLLP